MSEFIFEQQKAIAPGDEIDIPKSSFKLKGFGIKSITFSTEGCFIKIENKHGEKRFMPVDDFINEFLRSGKDDDKN